jgi:hypothetical protein
MNEEIDKIVKANQELSNVNKVLFNKLETAKLGLKAILESGNTNIAQETLNELENQEPE